MPWMRDDYPWASRGGDDYRRGLHPVLSLASVITGLILVTYIVLMVWR